MRPLDTRVFVEQADTQKKVGSIIIPETTEKPLEGSVIAVGENSTLKVGDRILYQLNRASEITKPDNSGSMLCIEEKHIYGVFE